MDGGEKVFGENWAGSFFSIDVVLLLGHGGIVLLFLVSWFRIKSDTA